jgi:dienelactone hydrolase
MARITLPSGTPAELARPSDDIPAGFGLVIVPDIGGLRPLFDDHVARLSAEQGWAVVAVDPFPGRTFPDGDMQARFAVMPEMDDDRLLGDLVDAADLLGTATVGCIGFCMGGMYALKASSTGAFHRICAFYGMVTVPGDWQGPGQGQPLDHLARAPEATKAMAVIGGNDTFTPADEVEQLRAAGVEIAFYPDAEHGFVHDPARPTHRPDDAADAWRRALSFLVS